MNNLFFSDSIPQGDRLRLTAEDSKHCLKVLRRQPGDTIAVTDGSGKLYHCRLLDNNLSGCELMIESEEVGHDLRPFYLHLAVSLIKNPSRFEWFLEKATEIGVGEITPLICERTEKQFFKKERYNKLLISAMKQSGRTRLPKLNSPIIIENLISLNNAEQRFIAWCGESPKPLLGNILKAGKDTMILIGPEGDFTQEEVNYSLANGFIPVSLGESRLRTETAGVFACVVFNIINS